VGASKKRLPIILKQVCEIRNNSIHNLFFPCWVDYIWLIMIEPILQFDRSLLHLINQDLANQFFWVPVYLFFLLYVFVNFPSKTIWWVLFFLATFALTDLISTQIIKALLQRPRPCADAITSQWVRMLIPCSYSPGFVSSHAANHFGISIFIFQTMKVFSKKWIWLVFVWAALVCYAQLYVGAHFPLDVVGGSILGLIIGSRTAAIFKHQFGGLQLA
jgi:membrane-associated phospholipid phosphatase